TEGEARIEVDFAVAPANAAKAPVPALQQDVDIRVPVGVEPTEHVQNPAPVREEAEWAVLFAERPPQTFRRCIVREKLRQETDCRQLRLVPSDALNLLAAELLVFDPAQSTPALLQNRFRAFATTPLLGDLRRQYARLLLLPHNEGFGKTGKNGS